MKLRRTTGAAAVALSICLGPAAALLADEWVLGGTGGIPWARFAKNTAQIDSQTAPGAIQMRGFSPDQNLLTTLKFTYGKPVDFVREGDAALWDNTAFRDAASLTIVDGDPASSTEDLFKRSGIDQSGRVFFLDLGSRVPAERLVFYPRQEGTDANGRPHSEDFVRRFEVQIADGQSYVTGQPLYQLLRDVPVNPASVATLRFPPQFIRFLRLRVGSRSPFEIAEVELYGDGFVPRASYESQVIPLGRASNYGRIFWSQQSLERVEGALGQSEDPRTSVTIRMRTGLDDTPPGLLPARDRSGDAGGQLRGDHGGSLRIAAGRGSLRRRRRQLERLVSAAPLGPADPVAEPTSLLPVADPAGRDGRSARQPVSTRSLSRVPFLPPKPCSAKSPSKASPVPSTGSLRSTAERRCVSRTT